MSDVREIRKKAALCRKAAGICTLGAADTDKLLIALAERLEQQADELEHTNPRDGARRGEGG